MKAMVCTKYGTPDVLQLKEVAKPAPKDNEVRIRILAATVGPADCAFRKGDPFIVKLIYGLRRPKYPILGTELSKNSARTKSSNQWRFRIGRYLCGTACQVLRGRGYRGMQYNQCRIGEVTGSR
ncbi:hypothetical protein PAAL109150_26675 [Paenibacillus alkaliterrae]